jgi:hypothetical protein
MKLNNLHMQIIRIINIKQAKLAQNSKSPSYRGAFTLNSVLLL